MSECSTLRPREFKSLVLRVVRDLTTRSGEGFSIGDVAKALVGSGCEFSKNRLRKVLDRAVEVEVLTKPKRGLYAAGAKFDDDLVLTVAVSLSDEIDCAFYQAGGILPIAELLEILGRESDGDARFVRACLSESPRYQSSFPFEGYRNHWSVNEMRRRAIPVAGRWLDLELRLAQSECGAGRSLGAFEANRLRDAYRTRICFVLGDARRVAGMTVSDLLSAPSIQSALASACATAVEVNAMEGERGSVASWWRTLDTGLANRLEVTWKHLENGTMPMLAHVLTVRFWVAIAQATRLEPASLSRGALMIASDSELRIAAGYVS